MLKKKIKYENPFTGETVERDFYFHISKGQLARLKLESELGGGLENMLAEMIANKDGKLIMDTVEKIILMACGERIGDTFDQSPEAVARFRNSEAYSELFLELCTNATACAEFISGAIPASLKNQLPAGALEEAGIDAVQLPHPLQTETDNRTHSLPDFNLGPVDEPTNAEPQGITAQDLLHMPLNDVKLLLVNPHEKGERVRNMVVAMPSEEFKRLMARFSGGNMPKPLLQIALQRD